jgi:hypothetical protein
MWEKLLSPARRRACVEQVRAQLGSCIRLPPEQRNHVWSYDFVEDRTHDGRKYRMLNVLDEFTHEFLAIRVARKLKAIDVIDVLSDLFILRGIPAHDLQRDRGKAHRSEISLRYRTKLGITFQSKQLGKYAPSRCLKSWRRGPAKRAPEPGGACCTNTTLRIFGIVGGPNSPTSPCTTKAAFISWPRKAFAACRWSNDEPFWRGSSVDRLSETAMTSTERLNLARNVQPHIRALQAAIHRLTELRAHYELTAISRALARLTSQLNDEKKWLTINAQKSSACCGASPILRIVDAGVAIAAKMAAENLETVQQILFNMLAPADESSGRHDCWNPPRRE